MADPKQNREHFEACVDTCADSLYRVAFRLTGNATLAGELVQETYLNAWLGVDSLHDVSRMRSWLFSILRFQYTKLLRREGKFGERVSDLDALPSPNQSRPNQVVDRVQAAMQQLPEMHKLPLLLVAMEGLSVEEAASSLNIPRGTVLSRLHRGRQKLKEILQSDEFGAKVSERNDGTKK